MPPRTQSEPIGRDVSRGVIRPAYSSTSSDDRPVPRRVETSRRALPETCQDLFQLVPERVERTHLLHGKLPPWGAESLPVRVRWGFRSAL